MEIRGTGKATECDKCREVSITHSDVSTQSADASNCAHYNYTITRTFTATGSEEHRGGKTHGFRGPPDPSQEISCPPDNTVNCQDPTDIAATGNATAPDNSSPLTIT